MELREFKHRTAIVDPRDPILDQWFEANGERRIKWLTTLSEVTGNQRVISDLETDGISVLPASEMVGKAYLAQMHERVIAEVCTKDTQAKIEANKAQEWKDFCILNRYGVNVLPEHPILRVGLDLNLLKTVAGYFGFWPRLSDICIHVNYPTKSEANASQLWHRDPGDIKLCKVFIYLTDVTLDNGPFTYIPGTQPFGRHAGVVPAWGAGAGQAVERERDIRWSDEEMNKVLPRKDWAHITGPIHTMILADTVGFHRGTKPKSGARILVCFTYTSGLPGGIMQRLTPPAWAKHEGQIWALR